VSGFGKPGCILIAGFGSIGKRHATIVRRQFPSARLVVLKHQRNQTVLDPSLGVSKCVFSVEEAINQRPDIAVVANPASHHMSIAVPLAKAGIHLLVEKPLSSVSADIKELIRCSSNSGSQVMVGYNLRFLPSLLQFRKLIRDKIIGIPLSVRAEVGQNLDSWRPGTDYRKSVSAQKALGGGVLLELSHEVDYLQWVFGDVAWVNATLTKQSALEIDVEDTAHLFLGFR